MQRINNVAVRPVSYTFQSTLHVPLLLLRDL